MLVTCKNKGCIHYWKLSKKEHCPAEESCPGYMSNRREGEKQIPKCKDCEFCKRIYTDQGKEGLEYGYVTVQAVQIKDYSKDLEYSQEDGIHVTVRDNRNGVNHLVCAGQGENQDRITLHLYVQKDGTIGKTQYYKGSEEIEAVYDYSSADKEKLEEDGRKKLKELQNYKKCTMTVDDIDLELGDIVSGYDAITDTQVIKPVKQKVVKCQNGKITIDYKVEGDD